MEITKHVTQDDMTLYSGPGNIHSDIEVAKRTGLDATIAQGVMTLAFASELMTRIHGSHWLERGEIEVKFTKPVFADDTVTIRATEQGEGHEVTAVNQDGETLMVGTARLR
ncbi:MAG: MaoC family dehydratase [Actinomycetota bacterium]